MLLMRVVVGEPSVTLHLEESGSLAIPTLLFMDIYNFEDYNTGVFQAI